MSERDLCYHEVRQKSVHNCFQRHEGVLDACLSAAGRRGGSDWDGERGERAVVGRVRRHGSGAAGVVAAVVLAGCGGGSVVSPTPPGPAPSHPACPAPGLSTSGWVSHIDSAGVSYRLPPDLVERPPGDLPYHQWTSSELSGGISIGFSPSREHWITLRRAPSPGMHEMSECVEERSDRQILIQAWRTEGGSFQNGRRSDLYEMLALVSVEPMLTLFITGGSADPRFQELLLGVARTVRVETPPR